MMRSKSRARKAANRISVSEAKAKFSSALRRVAAGESLIVTDHGKDVARIEAVREGGALPLIPAARPFSEARTARFTLPDGLKAASALELLREDRNRR